MMNEALPLFLFAGTAALLLMAVFWLTSCKIRKDSIIDIGWALAIVLCSAIYCARASGFILRKTLIFSLVLLWAGRLCLHLYKRLSRDKKEDPRYERLRKEWGTRAALNFFLLFEFQAVLAVVLSVPFLIIVFNKTPHIFPLEFLGTLICGAGLWGEHTADSQLKNFKSNPLNKGKVCQDGLWYYSRHPNYFFEWLIWVGYFIFALDSPYGWIGIISPLLMFYFLVYVTGVPFAEAQALISKGEAYRRYQETTSFFVPWIKKKA